MRSLKLSLALSIISVAALAAGCARGGADVGMNVNTASSSSGANAGQTTVPGQTASPAASQSPAVVAGQTANPAAQAGGAKADACALLTSDDVKAVQGEPVKDSKPSQRSDGALAVSQCFFSTATFNKSVSLEVTRGTPGTSARKFWEARFERAREEGGKGERERERERAREREREREREKKGEKKDERKGEEEEEESLPTPVKGIGDEAYWASSHVNGILYVLKGDAFIRVSIGGADDNAARLKKSKALAQKAISRL